MADVVWTQNSTELTLVCGISGECPLQGADFYKDGRKLDGPEVINPAKNESRYTIKSPNCDDTGEYSCNVTAKQWSLRTSALVKGRYSLYVENIQLAIRSFSAKWSNSENGLKNIYFLMDVIWESIL